MGNSDWGGGTWFGEDVSLNGIVYSGRVLAHYDAPMDLPVASIVPALTVEDVSVLADAHDWLGLVDAGNPQDRPDLFDFDAVETDGAFSATAHDGMNGNFSDIFIGGGAIGRHFGDLRSAFFDYEAPPFLPGNLDWP